MRRVPTPGLIHNIYIVVSIGRVELHVGRRRRGKQYDTLLKKKTNPFSRSTEVPHKANTGANKITFLYIKYIF